VLLAGDRVAGHAALRAALAWTREVAFVDEALTLEEAFGAAETADLVVIDVELLVPAGVEATVIGLRTGPARPEVVLAGRVADPEAVQDALGSGARSFLLLGPDVRQAKATIAAALDHRGVMGVESVRPLLDRHAVLIGAARARERAFVESLAAAVEIKDAVTSAHLRNVTQLAIKLAEHVEPALARDEGFVIGCLLHDVGKIGVPEDILMKPGPLTVDEWVVMRRHPDTGARVVAPLGLAPTVLEVVRHHHERWDGRGYPDRLGGERIPLAARVFSVCDALEAMTAVRPYRAPLELELAVERVLSGAGGQFDPDVVAGLERGLANGTIALGATLEAGARVA
jgi:putative nucleotidyltransferase with HDIG domain